MSLVTIIMPYYKKKKFIKRTYKSILNQSYKNYELIIIYDDDNLSDLQYIKKMIKKNPKVKILKNSINLGAGQSRNKGISIAKGKFIAFIDADDVWLKSKLATQINFMKKNNYDFTFTNYVKCFGKKKINVIVKNKIIYKDLLSSCSIGLSTVIIKKKLALKNLFSKSLTQEDYGAWLKITKKYQITAYNVNKTYTIWRNDNRSLSSNTLQKIKDAYGLYRKQEKFNIIRSCLLTIILSINSLKRKF
jgi:teichuronic acid biosynthesis glycosyltransferase TuaG